MAFKKSFNEIIGTVLVLSALLSTASAVDCHGKSFHCVNSTHFIICVDLGGGVSHSIDNFLIPCPEPTVCLGTNHFECEFPAPTTPVTTLNVISETTQPWEDVVVTTNSPQRKTTKEYSEKYLNTESLSLADSSTTDTTVDYTTGVPLSSAPIDLNNINVTESISIVPEASVYETTTTVDTITEPVLIYDTRTNLDQEENADNFTAEVITEIPQKFPENIATGAIEVTTEIPLVNISTVEAFISNASDIPQIIPENTTTGAGEAITEIPPVDITTVEAFISNPSDKPQMILEITTRAGDAITEIPLVDISTVEAFISNASDKTQIIPEITTGAGEAITEIPLVGISTVEAFISNASDIPQIIPENITTGAGEAITEIPFVDISTVEAFISNASDIPQVIPENIATGAGKAITEIPLVDISTVEAVISKASDKPQIIPEITTGAGEAITEIPLVGISTVEAFISNASDITQIIPENITTGAGEAITEIPPVDISTKEAIISNASDKTQIIPEITTGAGEAITEIPLVGISTVEAFISNTSDIPQVIPENIATVAGKAITEIPLVDISTVEAVISKASDKPQIIPEITTGAGEAITEIPLVGISTVEAFISNASDIPQIIPENITTGAGEAIKEIPLVDISTKEAIISNPSDKPQKIPEITTRAGDAITEIPLVDISTVEAFISNASDKPQIIPENIATGAGEAITEIPFVDISTVEAFVSNASDIPQVIPENIATGAGEAITEIPLVDISTVEAFISNASDIPQVIPENIATGAGKAITEIPLVDISTVEAVISKASDKPQIIPEITTGAGEAITEIPLVGISTVEAFISNVSDIPQIIPENITTGAGEAIKEIPLVDISTKEAIISNPSDKPQKIPEITTRAGDAITEIPLVDISTVEAFISNASDKPQIIPENIATGAGEAITEIPFVDISTVEAFVSNASDIPQVIPENIATGAGEAITEIPLVDISTVEAFISNASDITQIIPENITTGAGEAITEIPPVDISTKEAIISNPSNKPQKIPEITTRAGDAITEIPLVDISTVEAFISNASDIPQIIPENIATGAGEAITEIPFVDISTVEAFISNASDIPQVIPENIATGAGEAITEIPLVDISTVEAVISKASDKPQIIPENITTGAEEAKTEIPFVDISTVEAFISNASDVPQIIPENITTGAEKAITENPIVDISTVNTNNVVPETTLFTISASDSSSNINVNLKPVSENTTNINVTSNETVNVKDYVETTLSTLNTDTIVGTEQVVTTTTEQSYTAEVNYLTNNQLGFSGDLERNSATLEQTTSDYLNFDMESLYTNQPSTIGPEEILTTDTTVITELPALNEHNSLNRLPTTIKTVVTQDGVTINSFATENPTLLINQKDQTQTDDINTTERSFIVTKNDQVQSVTTDIVTVTNTNNLTVENIISSLQNNTRSETNETIKNQEEKMYTTENGLFKDNTETKETKSTVADMPIGENKTDTNTLANTIFDTVISKVETSTEKSSPVISDKNLQTAAQKIITTETPLLSTSNDQIQQVTGDVALNTEKTTLTAENKVIMDNTNLINENSTQNTTTPFPQDQEASIIESGHVATEQSNINTSDNAVTTETENSVYLPTDNSILTTIEGFDEKLQSSNSTEQPITVTFDEKLQTVANENIKTERPIFSTTNEQAPLKLKDEKALGKEKPIIIIIKSDNFEKDVNNNLTIEDSKVIIINDTEETIIKNPQDGVRSTTENEYIKDGIIKVQPEITVVTTDSTTNTDILESDSLTTITNSLQTGITIEDQPDITNNNTIPKNQDVIVTTDAVTEEANPAMPGIVKTNLSNWGDTITTYNPLEESAKPASSIFDINAIQTDLNKEQAMQKVFEGSVTTNTPTGTNLYYIDNILPLDTINGGFGSSNQNEQETIGSNKNVQKTTLTNEKGTKSEITSEITAEDDQISPIDKIEVQENTSALLGTTENINVIVITSSVILGAPHKNDVKQIEITIDGTNATGQNSQDTEMDRSIPNIPVTETNIISQTNQNRDADIGQLGTNIRTDAVDYKTVAIDYFSRTDNSVTESTHLSVNSDLGKIDNNIIPQQSQITSEFIDKGKSNLLETVEGSTNSNQIISDLQGNTVINKSNQEAEQTNVAGTLVTVASNDNKTMTESTNGPNITKAYPQSINDNKTSKDIIITAASINENLLSTGLKNELSSNLADNVRPPTIATTTKTVNKSIDNYDVPSSSVPVRNNETKYTVLENIQNSLQAIDNFFNTASKNLTRYENNIHVSEVMTEANTATESETVLDSTVFHNLQVSKASEIVPKPDANKKWGSTESGPVYKGQHIENKNVNKLEAHIVPFDEPSRLTNKAEDQVIANGGVSKTITSGISPEMVMKPATLDILTTKTIEIGSSGTANATINSRTTNTPNNLLQNLPLPRVNTKELANSSTSEKTITNGVRPDIGPVFVNINTNLNEKPNVENAIAREYIGQKIRPISTLIPGNSVTQVNNILQSTDISYSITDSTFDENTQKDLSTNSIKPHQISGLAQNTKPPTYAAKVVPENINQIIVPSNKQSDLAGQQDAPVSTDEKEIKTHIPQNSTQKITFTGTVFPGPNSSAASKNASQTETNNIVSVISRNNTIGGNEQKTINVQQNTSVNTTEQFKHQITSTKKPVQKQNSSLTSTTQASTKKPASKSISTVIENPKKQVVNNTLNYSCINGVRGRYSDKDDCRKFYICMGNTEPIIGHCPVNTVFSDIKKICTKNMSHCIRENEFKCPSDGRFIDVIKDNVYYICVNHKNHLYRFKFQCQKGFTLNKSIVRCVENKEIESNEAVSISSDNENESSDSTSSTSSSSRSSGSSSITKSSSNTSGESENNSTKSKQKKERSEDKEDDDDEVFECEKQGKFPVRNDCQRYYLCKKNRKGQYRRKLKKCDSGDVFHKSKKKCVDADDYEC